MEKIDRTKAILGVIRECILILIFILLFVFPGWVKGRLEASGIRNIDLGFARWESALEESKEHLAEAEEKVVEVQQQLMKVSSALDQISRAPQASENVIQTRQLKSLRVQIDSSAANLGRFDTRLKESLTMHDQLMRQLQTEKTK